MTWPIAELTIRYVRSATYPGAIVVEVAPIHVGRTAFTLGYGIFDREGCVAVARADLLVLLPSCGPATRIDIRPG